MFMNNLIKKSREIKKDADKILSDAKLIKILANYGEVEITGSYATDLMMTGDIDIHLFGQFDRKKAKLILNNLIEKTKFTGYMFFDWVTYRNPAFPVGYYIGLKQKVKGYEHQWKIDIWLVEKDRAESVKYMQKLRKVTDPEKLAILSLKKWRDEKCPDLSSAKIYDAVIDMGVRTIQEFKKELKC